jgi:hypothetical protein
MAGRASLGGPRELALACFVVARVVAGDDADAGAEGGGSISPDQRRERIQAAKHWLAAAAVPGPLRMALTRLADAALEGDRKAIRAAVDSVMTVTANQLDPAARLELGRLSQTIVE